MVQVGAAAGTNPFAAGIADRFEGNEKIDLFNQDFFQVNLVVFKKNVFQFFFIQGSAAQVNRFLGKEDNIKTGVDFEFKLLQAADANQ